MKKTAVKLLSSLVRGAAQKSANSVSDWKYFQPKVPSKLKK